jgi:hypothetical protein
MIDFLNIVQQRRLECLLVKMDLAFDPIHVLACPGSYFNRRRVAKRSKNLPNC